MAVGDAVEVRAGGRAHRVVVAETFASVAAGELVLHEDSFGSLALAVNQGRAADRLGAGSGDPVEIALKRAGEGLMGRRVLVTGAARSTGRRLVAALAEEPEVEQVVAVDELEPEEPFPAKVEHLAVDLRSPALVRTVQSAGSTPACTWG